jgi:hypothetical protein
MRTSAAIVAVVVLIAIAATIDALQDGGSFAPAPEDTVTREASGPPPPPAAPEENFRAAGVSGRLYFSVEVGGACFVRSLDLPDLEGAAEVAVEACGFDVSPQGAIVAGPPCPGRSFRVYPADGPSVEYDGCAPAWQPDGELTFVRDGDVVSLKGGLVRNPARFARNALGRDRLLIRQVAWLTDTRLAVRVTTRGAGPSVVVVLSEGKAVPEPFFTDRDAQIEISHATEEILVTFGGGFVEVFSPTGALVSASRFPFGSIAAVAYSPDGHFVALARPDNLCIYEVRDPPPREWFPVACLPFDAVDLAWG